MFGTLGLAFSIVYVLLGSLLSIWSWRQPEPAAQTALHAIIEQAKTPNRPVPGQRAAHALGTLFAFVVATLFWPVALVNHLRRPRAPEHARPVRPIRVLRQPPADSDD
ncbi:MAG: hypothetical protein EOM91_17230 [Sphingobacteriia bacterium]|jgi:hypothetical protein|nr:hypothetical protein [Sphingobacteriia bacterium]